ncbi:zinc-binding dehydrogenase [Peribacillus frigoritolerans]|uniref:zinc-binding dehydrogenase n=1 Tax=Peribacillus frigoritolerans TaxID=450367 RepID=UPI0038084E2A
MGGAELIVDGIGGLGFNQLVDVTAPGDCIVYFGAKNGRVSELVLPKLFFKQLGIKGSSVGSPREFAHLLHFYELYRLKPIFL